MANYIEQVEICKRIVNEVLSVPPTASGYYGVDLVREVKHLTDLLPEKFEIFKQRLNTKILPNIVVKGAGYNQFGQIVPNVNMGLSPVILGELIATLDYIDKSVDSSIGGIDWNVIHPLIVRVSKERFDVAQYADAVEAAFKTINNEVKKIVYEKTSEEIDGNPLMQKAFNKNNPLIRFNESELRTDQDIQQGYQFMFSGAMLGIRNPKAHEVEKISKPDATRKLHFASMLMFKLDSRVKE